MIIGGNPTSLYVITDTHYIGVGGGGRNGFGLFIGRLDRVDFPTLKKKKTTIIWQISIGIVERFNKP